MISVVDLGLSQPGCFPNYRGILSHDHRSWLPRPKTLVVRLTISSCPPRLFIRGRIFTVLAASLSVATAYIAFRFNNLMDYLQLLFSLFNAPLFASFLLGMFTTLGNTKRWVLGTSLE